jgi:NAD kinase
LAEHQKYLAARRTVESALASCARVRLLDRGFLPTYLFAPDDVVVALGQDGVVADTLKYLDGQPLIGVNPDPGHYDGVLLPFQSADIARILPEVFANRRAAKNVTTSSSARSHTRRPVMSFTSDLDPRSNPRAESSSLPGWARPLG